MIKITDTVKHLIIINVLLWVAATFAFPSLQELFALYYPANPKFGFWQFVTSMFMHSQTLYVHIIFNMLGIWMFGSPLEQIWGRNKFLFFYFSAGIGAGLIYTGVNYFQFQGLYSSFLEMGVNPEDLHQTLISGRGVGTVSLLPTEKVQELYNIFNTPAVGASGALYGVLVAFGMKFPDAKLALIFFPVPVAAKYFIPGLIAIDLISGLTGRSLFGDGIAHFAHVGGAVVGLLIMLYWKKTEFKRWDR